MFHIFNFSTHKKNIKNIILFLGNYEKYFKIYIKMFVILFYSYTL